MNTWPEVENMTREMRLSGDDTNSAPEPLRLDHFMKLCALSETGGQAKLMIQNGEVKVNGVIETRRRRKLSVADVVQVGSKTFRVTETLAAD